jgi:hypothetical protein
LAKICSGSAIMAKGTIKITFLLDLHQNFS